MNTILNSLSEADKNKSFLTIYKDGADFDIKLSDFAFAISAGSLKLLNGINLSTSLTEVTDVIGTISPLQLSTTQVNVGGGTSLGRLVVKGDGTNPVARFENSSGANGWYFSASGSSLNSDSQFRIQGPAIANDSSIVLGSYNQLSTTSGIQTIATVQSNIGCALGSGNKRIFSTEYTINNSGVQTGNATGIFLNATETALNGITHNLMDLQVGGVSKAKISNLGAIILTGEVRCDYIQLGATSFGLYFNTRGTMNAAGDGVFTLKDFAGTSFGRLQLGGTTSSFPAIKRNGAAIDFRLADDSNYAALNTGATFIKGSGSTSATNSLLVQNSASTQTLKVNDDGSINIGQQLNNNFPYINLSGIYGGLFLNTGDSIVFRSAGTEAMRVNAALNVGIGASTIDASAKLQVDTTTQGFLMPRMTTAQILLITLPANGLMVYNTTLNQPCFFDGTIWNKVNHSPM